MKIALHSHYKSLAPFDEIDLPDFTVIVGLNGTGKSQLLEAIQSGTVECDSKTNEEYENIVLLTNNTIGLISELFTYKDNKKEITDLYENFNKKRNNFFVNQKEEIKNLFKETPLKYTPPHDILMTPQEELISKIGNCDPIKILKKLITINNFLSNMLDDISIFPIEDYENQTKYTMNFKCLSKEIRLLTLDDFLSFQKWGEYNPYNAHLPQLFGNYRQEQIDNQAKAARDEQPAAPDWLDDAAFEKKYGKAPWEQISDLLALFGLKYKIAPPAPRRIDTIGLHFERTDKHETYITFEELSAGEKVLVSLVASLVQIDPSYANIKLPDLLLLDEIDASLHPAMLHEWMNILQEKVVKTLDIKCILTTHSPITVALAPEGSVFDMSTEAPQLKTTTKQQALNKLTVGLPALNMDFTKRREVFVEADVDAKVYEKLYILCRDTLNLPCSLSFLSTGIIKEKVEQGTGCAAVKKIVGELKSFGSLSAFGLIDWDTKNKSDDRIIVLGEGEYYALDNIILHPLLIGILLIRECEPPAEGLPSSYSKINTNDATELQRIADAVQNKLTYPTGAPQGTTITRFKGGQAIKTHTAFCQSNGHDIEKCLKKAFPKLHSFSRKRGELADTIIKRVVNDREDLCPEPIIDAFTVLATMQSCKETPPQPSK